MERGNIDPYNDEQYEDRLIHPMETGTHIFTNYETQKSANTYYILATSFFAGKL